MKFEKILNKIQTWSIFKNWNFYPYSVEYVWEDEFWDGSVFFVKFLQINQEFLEEDLEEFFDLMVYEVIDIFIKEQQNKLQAISVRYFEKDIQSLKKYAEKNACSYQVLMRNAINEYTKTLEK